MFTSQRRPISLSSAEEEEDGMKDVEFDELYDYNEDESEKSESIGDGQGYSAVPQVVEPGTEHTGRWTREEHEAFLSALRQYGKEWKKVAARVKTRTVVQTRTHAQKYFQKLQKDSGGTNHDGDDESPDLVIATDFKRKSAPPTMDKEKKSTQSTDQNLQVIMPKRSHQAQDGTIETSHILSNLSKAVTHPTFDSNEQNQKPFERTHFSPQFFYLNGHIPSSYPNNQKSPLNHGSGSTQMKIIPPAPEFSLGKSAYPEPSPAACGKRKDMEIAAAELLADVASTMVKSQELNHIFPKKSPPLLPLKCADLSEPSAKPGVINMNSNLQIVNPEKLVQSKDSDKFIISPATPWETSLAELVRNVQCRESQMNVETEDIKILVAVHPLETTLKHRSQFHSLICSGSLQLANKMIDETRRLSYSDKGSEKLKALVLDCDSLGFSPLHSAVCLLAAESGINRALEATTLLLLSGADVSHCDTYGNTALHWAARSGNSEVLQILAMHGCPLDSSNLMGETALHWATRAGRFGKRATCTLLTLGARISTYNYLFRRPLDVAATKFIDVDEDMQRHLAKRGTSTAEASLIVNANKINTFLTSATSEKQETRGNFFQNSPQSRTLVLHHPECLDHVPKAQFDWESPERVKSIIKTIEGAISNGAECSCKLHEYEIQLSSDFERASLELLSRVHSAEYLAFVHDLSKELEQRHSSRGNQAIPFTPVVQRALMKDAPTKAASQSDTSFSSGSLRAARRAAGSVQHAVDCVLIGRNRNAFCVVRPPGHHAGVNGLLAGSESCGFCIFNNVAAGAMHALSDERNGPSCERCAIIDIDAHHGNGTEEIVRNCRDPRRLFLFSVHLFDNMNIKTNGQRSHYKFYPGSGSDDDLTRNIINVPIAPLWKSDADTTKESIPSSYSSAQEPDYQGTGREAYRQAITKRLLPALRAFNPDLILISIGFDTARGDVGNAKHCVGGEFQMGLNLEPEDYSWTTRKIMEVADICCQGRVISVLEGGYGSYSNAAASKGHQPEHLDRSIFCDCALRHLSAMIDPYDE